MDLFATIRAQRHKLGVITPLDPDETPGKATAEFELLKPTECLLDVAFQRVPVAEDGSQLPIGVRFVTELGTDPQLEELARHLSESGSAAIAYSCTSASFVGGPIFAQNQADRLSSAAGVVCTNTSLAVKEALAALGIERVAVATPYVDELNERLVSFLSASGFSVASLVSLRRAYAHSTTPTDRIIGAARVAALESEAEGIFIACTGQKVGAELAGLEVELGIPVITANQATLWHVGNLAGMSPAAGPGTLYSAA